MPRDGRRVELVQGAARGTGTGQGAEGMPAVQMSNYLFFTTTCEQALAFYARCGLGRVVEVRRHGEGGLPVRDEAMRGRVMHARFEGPGVLFYASDNDDAEPMRGSAHILMTDDPEPSRRLFGRLADGGTVTTPLAVQPWGDLYGKLTDRFGVQWMLNCSVRAAAKPAGPTPKEERP